MWKIIRWKECERNVVKSYVVYFTEFFRCTWIIKLNKRARRFRVRNDINMHINMNHVYRYVWVFVSGWFWSWHKTRMMRMRARMGLSASVRKRHTCEGELGDNDRGKKSWRRKKRGEIIWERSRRLHIYLYEVVVGCRAWWTPGFGARPSRVFAPRLAPTVAHRFLSALHTPLVARSRTLVSFYVLYSSFSFLSSSWRPSFAPVRAHMHVHSDTMPFSLSPFRPSFYRVSALALTPVCIPSLSFFHNIEQSSENTDFRSQNCNSQLIPLLESLILTQ